MLKNLQLQINKPCAENWDRMKPQENGRFCAACSKTVVDFTHMSDRELADWFAHPESNQNTCGRLHQTQLKRELIPGRQQKNRATLFWNYLMAALLIGNEARTQNIGTNTKAPTCQHDSSLEVIVVGGLASRKTVRHRPSIKDLPDSLRGRFTSPAYGQPVPFAIITASGGRKFAADADGYFVIPRNSVTSPYRMSISSVGYKTTEIDMIKTWRNGGHQIINIPIECVVMGEMVVTTRVTKIKKIASLLKDTLSFFGPSKEPLSVYPNPVARGATVKLSADLQQPGKYTIQLLDLSGAVVETAQMEGNKNMQPATLSIPGTIASGVYIIRVLHPALKKEYAQQIQVF